MAAITYTTKLTLQSIIDVLKDWRDQYYPADHTLDQFLYYYNGPLSEPLQGLFERCSGLYLNHTKVSQLLFYATNMKTKYPERAEVPFVWEFYTNPNHYWYDGVSTASTKELRDWETKLVPAETSSTTPTTPERALLVQTKSKSTEDQRNDALTQMIAVAKGQLEQIQQLQNQVKSQEETIKAQELYLKEKDEEIAKLQQQLVESVVPVDPFSAEERGDLSLFGIRV